LLAVRTAMSRARSRTSRSTPSILRTRRAVSRRRRASAATLPM